MWTRLLQDKKYLDWFISENQKRLAKHHAILTDFLDEHKVPYIEGSNAAVFVWIDLRQWLLGNDDTNVKKLRVTHPGVHKYKELEQSLNNHWLGKGVWLSKGSNSLSEELGWFRIVFTAEERAFRTGLERFWTGLNEWAAERRA
jgi:aspartate/methionine/tyrosine aminotransferase